MFDTVRYGNAKPNVAPPGGEGEELTMYPLSSITSILSINGWEMVSNVFAVATNRQLDRSTGTLTGRSKGRKATQSADRQITNDTKACQDVP
jgi:hypothetical protein